MKATRLKTMLSSVLIVVFFTGSLLKGYAQDKFHSSTLNVTVAGTSSLHDWEMVSNEGKVDATINVDKENVSFTGLNFTFPAESLKSGHDMMDKNTYKALNTSKNPNISFALTSSTLTPAGGNTYHFRGVGKLTINGTTVLTDILATVKYNPADKTFTCTGTKKFKMTQYNVKPPTAMMGTIKTGDEVAISYNLTIKG